MGNVLHYFSFGLAKTIKSREIRSVSVVRPFWIESLPQSPDTPAGRSGVSDPSPGTLPRVGDRSLTYCPSEKTRFTLFLWNGRNGTGLEYSLLDVSLRFYE